MKLTKERARTAVSKLKDRLHSLLGERVTLYVFGSVARGDFGPESDIDILVLVGGLNDEDEKRVMREAFNIELEQDVVFGLMIESKEKWQSPLYQAMPIHKVIDAEGVRL